MSEDVGEWGREEDIEEDLMEGLQRPNWMDQGDQGGQGHSLGQEYFDMVGKRYQESQVSGNVARKKGQGINYTVREKEGGARKVEQTEQGAELVAAWYFSVPSPQPH